MTIVYDVNEQGEKTVTANLSKESNSVALLEEVIREIEQEESEIAKHRDQIKLRLAEAKASGFNVKMVRRLVKERKRNASDIEQEHQEWLAYCAATGLQGYGNPLDALDE